MSKKVGVVIGQFVPMSLIHQELIDTAHEECDEVVVLVGSALQYQSADLPLTFEQRKYLIQSMYGGYDDIHVMPLRDYLAGDDADLRWETEVFHQVGLFLSEGDEVTIYHNKVERSYDYEACFPEWKVVDIGFGVKPDMFCTPYQLLEGDLDGASLEVEEAFDVMEYPEHKRLSDEVEMLVNDADPFVVYLAVDACVVGIDGEKAYILLAKRPEDSGFGAGVWAMVGGIVGSDETISEALKRVSMLKVGAEIETTYESQYRLYDRIDRDPRARVVTTCVTVTLDELPELGDEYEYKWATVEELHSLYSKGEMFLDHYDILENVLFNQ